MAGLVPAIRSGRAATTDGRDKPGHDDESDAESEPGFLLGARRRSNLGRSWRAPRDRDCFVAPLPRNDIGLGRVTVHRIRVATLAMLLGISASPITAEPNAITLPSNDAALVQPHNVTVTAVALRRQRCARGPSDRPIPSVRTRTLSRSCRTWISTMARSRWMSPDRRCRMHHLARVVSSESTFRIDATGGSFSCEGFYIRPTNGRAEDQVRRNHSTQYFSYPGYDFDRLRREAPGQYEFLRRPRAPANGPTLRLEVSGAAARLFVGAAPQPVLVVRDLKRGPDAHGTVGLWVDNGTDGHFRNLSIHAR